MPILNYVHPTETAFAESAWGIQTAVGTAPTSLTRFLGCNAKPQPKITINPFTPENSLAPSARQEGRKWSETSIDGILTYEESKTFIQTIEAVTQVDPELITIYHNKTMYLDNVVTGWTIEATSEGVTTTASLMGEFSSTPATAPTITCAPIYAYSGGFTLTIDTVEITDINSVRIEAQNVWGQLFFNKQTPQKVIQRQPSVTFSATIGASDDNKELALTAGEHAVVLTTSQTVGTDTYTYTFSGSVYFTEPGQESDADGLYAFSLNGTFCSTSCIANADLVTVAFTATP